MSRPLSLIIFYKFQWTQIAPYPYSVYESERVIMMCVCYVFVFAITWYLATNPVIVFHHSCVRMNDHWSILKSPLPLHQHHRILLQCGEQENTKNLHQLLCEAQTQGCSCAAHLLSFIAYIQTISDMPMWNSQLKSISVCFRNSRRSQIRLTFVCLEVGGVCESQGRIQI